MLVERYNWSAGRDGWDESWEWANETCAKGDNERNADEPFSENSSHDLNGYYDCSAVLRHQCCKLYICYNLELLNLLKE